MRIPFALCFFCLFAIKIYYKMSMIHSPRENIFANFDWGRLWPPVLCPQSQVQNCKDSLNHAQKGKGVYAAVWFVAMGKVKQKVAPVWLWSAVASSNQMRC